MRDELAIFEVKDEYLLKFWSNAHWTVLKTKNQKKKKKNLQYVHSYLNMHIFVSNHTMSIMPPPHLTLAKPKSGFLKMSIHTIHII